MLYAPDSFVFAVQTVPRSVSVAVTVAPLIGAPDGSVTVPTMAAVTSCPFAGDVKESNPARTRRQRVNESARFITEPPTRLSCSAATDAHIKNGHMLYSTLKITS